MREQRISFSLCMRVFEQKSLAKNSRLRHRIFKAPSTKVNRKEICEKESDTKNDEKCPLVACIHCGHFFFFFAA